MFKEMASGAVRNEKSAFETWCCCCQVVESLVVVLVRWKPDEGVLFESVIFTIINENNINMQWGIGLISMHMIGALLLTLPMGSYQDAVDFAVAKSEDKLQEVMETAMRREKHGLPPPAPDTEQLSSESDQQSVPSVKPPSESSESSSNKQPVCGSRLDIGGDLSLPVAPFKRGCVFARPPLFCFSSPQHIITLDDELPTKLCHDNDGTSDSA